MVKVRGRNSNRKTVKQTAENGQKSRVTTPRGRHESLVPGTCTSRLRISRVTLHDCEVAPVWHHDVTNARTCQFFRRLFDRLPVRISTSDLYHRILRKKKKFYGKKSIISELMILECSFPLTSPGLTGNHIHLNGETGPCCTLYVKGSTKRPN